MFNALILIDPAQIERLAFAQEGVKK